MARASARIDGAGRLVIPVEFRRALSLEKGTPVTLTLEDGALRVRTLADGIKRAQALVATYVPANVSLVDELLADRRAEVAAERD